MDDQDTFGLSLRINQIMSVLKKEDFIEILVHCVESMIMIPRYELISIIDVLSEYMLEKNKFDDDFRKNVNIAKKIDHPSL